MLLALVLAAAQSNPYLAQAKLFQQTGDYKQCLKRIEQAQKWESSRDEQLEIAIYAGLCNFALLKTKDAEAEFTVALKIDPTAKLPPFSSPKVVALFESLRPKEAPVAKAEPEKPPPEPVKPEPVKPEPEKPAPVVVEQPRPPPPQPSRASVPISPIVSAAAAVVALGVGIGFGVNASSLQSQAVAATFQLDEFNLKHSADGFALGADVAYAVAGVALIAAVVLFFVTRGD